MKLLPSVRLPYNVIRGSASERSKMAERKTDEFFQGIKHLFKGGETPDVTELFGPMDKAIGDIEDQLIIDIALSYDKFERGSCNYVIDKNSDIEKYQIIFPGIKKDCFKLSNDIGSIVHEFRHFMDNLFSPKKPQGLASLYNKYPKETVEYLYEVYKKNIYFNTGNLITKMPTDIELNAIKSRLNNDLEIFTNYEKVSILQHFRNKLESEINAYDATSKYSKILKEATTDCPVDQSNVNSERFYYTKLTLLKQMIKDCIQKERKSSFLQKT